MKKYLFPSSEELKELNANEIANLLKNNGFQFQACKNMNTIKEQIITLL